MAKTFTILLGTIELPRSTGEWVQDPDGGRWQKHTSTRWLDAQGNCYREEPYEPVVRFFIHGKSEDFPR